MPESAYYKINSPTVINETIENESVIINLDNGFYYSLESVGAEIWDALDKHISLSDICTGLAKKYNIEKDTAESTVNEFITQLIKENLIVPLSESERTTNNLTCLFRGRASAQFSKPVLNKFGDMQDLLLLDPIHEVDEAGWPHSKPENPSKE